MAHSLGDFRRACLYYSHAPHEPRRDRELSWSLPAQTLAQNEVQERNRALKWFTDNEFQSCAIRRWRFAKPFILVACLLFAMEGSIRCGLAQQPAGAPLEKVSAEHALQMAKGVEVFKKTVGPLLVGRCVKCHGGEQTESEFDLTDREKLLKGGTEGPAVVIGKGRESRLYKLVAHLEEPYMPEDGARLSETDLAAIASWIDWGAPYDKPLKGVDSDPTAWTRTAIDEARRDFWSFLPLKKVAIPTVPGDSWSHTTVDKFVLSNATAAGVKPNPLAERRNLLRRVYYDLTGLPPPPAVVESFINSDDPDAYPKLIDQLLDSPHYGERWGRHWLDIARFAESHGFEQDYDRPYAYHYRDFVIKALNSDMPYDQFVRWQIAGDEFAPENPLAMMATGFLGAGVFPTQLTEKEFEPARYDELDDMVSTTGTAFLGLTIGCARCHDHKFDPIPAADYYRIAAAFATTIRSEIELDLDPENYCRAKEAYDLEHQPLVAVLQEYESTELEQKFAEWLQGPARSQTLDAPWHVLDLVEFESKKGATMTKLDDGSILVSGENPKQDHYRFTAETRLQGITGFRLDTLTHPSFPKGGPGRATNGNFALSDFKITVKPLNDAQALEKPIPVKLVDARATHQQDTGHLAVKGSIDEGYESGWAVDKGGIGKDQSAVFDCEKPIDFAGGVRLTFEMRFGNNVQHSIGRPRLSLTAAAVPVPLEGTQVSQHVVDAFAVLKEIGPEKLTDLQRKAVRRWFAEQDPRWQELHKAVVAHEARQPKPSLTKVMVTSEGLKPIPHHADDRGFPHFYPDVHFLKRGDSQQKQGVASTGFLQVLMTADEREKHWQVAAEAGARTSFRRRALADWMCDQEYGAGNLLARVIVNRLWHHHLGRGIVSTPNDFGYQGQRPTHPELLDWLAGQLIADNWRLKATHKRIMTSAVYMQSAAFDDADAKIDPENALLWRYTPRRLEAETIRDALLAVSGDLDRTPFGPGSLDESMKRRSIYFMVKRSKLIPMMQLFDAPEPLAGVGDRPSTTIAPQSLMFLNNPQVRRSAGNLARNCSAAGGGDSLEKAIRHAYLTTLSRTPTAQELEAAIAFVKKQSDSYRADKHANASQSALTDFCQVLFSLNEFIYID